MITAGNVKQETTVCPISVNPVWNQTILMRVPIDQVRVDSGFVCVVFRR